MGNNLNVTGKHVITTTISTPTYKIKKTEKLKNMNNKENTGIPNINRQVSIFYRNL